jgi:hypothetical protein
MNTKNLAKRYDQLTPREHLLSILAALARGDNVERKRLLDSAPRIGFQAPHHYELAETLIEAAKFHLMILLDLAVKYQKWWGLWGWHCLRRQTDAAQDQGEAAAAGTDTEEFRLYSITRHHAFLFVTYFDGWKQFCSELPIDADVLLDVMPGWDMVVRTEAEARARAFSRDDTMMFLLGEAIDGHEDEAEDLELSPVPTVEGLAKEWHGFMDRRGEHCPLAGGKC